MYPKNISLILIIITCFLLPVKSQRVVTYGLQLNPGLSVFSAKPSKGMTDFKKSNKLAINFGIAGNYYLDKKISISTGIQYYNYGFEVSGNQFYAEIKTKDSEGKSYIRKIWGEQIKEKTSFALIQIPLALQIEYPLTRDIHPFLAAGPVISIPLQSKTAGSGTFTYKGYYADGNYTLEDIPIYGFSSDLPVNTNGSTGLRMISFQGMITAGCTFTMSRYWKFITTVQYLRFLTKPTRKPEGDYAFSNELGSFYSYAGSRESNLNMISVGISIQKVLLF